MKVHYWELSNYNNGSLVGRWFDLDGLTKDEHYAELGDWLAELTDETGELCEEWIIGDVDDVPDQYHHEYGLRDELFEFIEVIETSMMDAEILLAGIACDIDLARIEQAYHGTYDSILDFAYAHADGLGIDQIMGTLSIYFDYEAYARDVMTEYVEHGGHYFNNNW